MEAAQSKTNAVAFLTAHIAGDTEATKALCASDFESLVFAPIEIFPHLGQKKGLDWLEESIRTQERRYKTRKFEILNAFAEGEEAVVVASMRLTKRSDARVIQFVAAHIFGFRDGLIVRHRELFDSFAVLEQLLGEDLTKEFAGRLSRAM